jgi:pyruvate kinase
MVSSRKYSDPVKRTSDAVANGVMEVAKESGAKLIIALTDKGFAARTISRFKPEQKIIALTPSERTRNQLALSYGCVPIVCKKFVDVAGAIKEAKSIVLKNKFAVKGDKIIMVFGFPLGKSGGTNSIIVETL